MESFIKLHGHIFIKVLLVIGAVILVVFAANYYASTQKIKSQQAIEAQRTVINHTQTLSEIQKAVAELKTDDQADHAQTVTYINCVLVGITNSPTPAQADLVYKECLSAAGVN
jgi:sensor histidine kinase regulating citrate/malate metabolism